MESNKLFTGDGNGLAQGVCGQISSLTTTLRGILKDYGGSQVLNEMLQNADDAGATHFKVCFDRRRSAFQKN